jgi:2-polyprenyl-6-methoxyphenol hydroxylase-like FAD-dependent oxidoreductase
MNLPSSTLPVLIVGAGPVGLTLACELARRDVPFRLIERAASPALSSRAKALQPRSLEILHDLGIAERLMATGTTELPYRKFAGNRMIGETPRRAFPREDTRYPKTLLLPQWQVEEALRTRLAELGGTVEWGTELTDFTVTDHGVTCRLQSLDGAEEITSDDPALGSSGQSALRNPHPAISCTYLIACDGGKSTTRKKLGITFAGETHQEEQLWVGDVELEGLAPDAWYNWLSPKFGLAFALFPFKGTNTWQVQAVMPPDANGQTPMPTLESFNALFRERTQMEGVTFTKSTWQSVYRVNIRRAERYRVGNAFLVGDVAHAHSIAGGMGMNTGIQDAYNLGWKLAAVLRGEADARLLDTYAEERIPIADWLLTTTSQRQQVMMNAAVAGAGSMDKIATKETTQLDLNYRDRRLSARGITTASGLQAGDRAPDVKSADGSWLSDRLRGTQWKLLVFGGQSAAIDAQLTVVPAYDPALIKAYGLSDGFVLIRPDGHVALIAPAFDEVNQYLDRLAA